MIHNVLRRTISVLLLMVVVTAPSLIFAASDSGGERESIFYRTANMSGMGLPEVSLAVADNPVRSGLVLAVSTARDGDRFDQLVDLKVSIPSSRDLQETIDAAGISGSPGVERGNNAADEEMPVGKPSIRFESATMLLFGAGLIGVAEVLRRKKRIK